MLAVRNIEKRLGKFELRNVSFDVGDGGYLVLLGASGAGKSVLLEILAGLTLPECGEVLCDGIDITHASLQARKMGMVTQNPSLFPHMTVRQNIAYGLRSGRMSRRAILERVSTLAVEVGAGHLLERRPGMLSGGEVQRVALARALAMEPRCLLLDEPVSSLDMTARGAMRSLLQRINRTGLTIIHATHDYEEAMSLANRVAIVEDGYVKQVGSPQEVFQNPKCKFAARFVGVHNYYAGKLERPNDSDLARFVTNGCVFLVASDAAEGPGHFALCSQDVALSRVPLAENGQNVFQGIVVELVPIPTGDEIVINVGVDIVARVARSSEGVSEVKPGHRVWISFEAHSARFIEA